MHQNNFPQRASTRFSKNGFGMNDRSFGHLRRFLSGLLAISTLSIVGVIGTPASTTTIRPLNGENGIFAISGENDTETAGRPSIAFDGTNFLTVWMDSSQTIIGGAIVSQDGVVLQRFQIASNHGTVFAPSVAFDGTNYMVVWTGTVEVFNDPDIYGARVSPNGVVLDQTPIRITTNAQPKYRPDPITFDGTNFLIAWRTTGDMITVARLTTSGVNLEGDTGIELGNGYYPWIAFNGTNFLVAWHYFGTNGLDIFGSLVSTDGTILPPGIITITSELNDQDHSSVASNGTDFFVSWHDWTNTDDYGNGSAHGTRVSAEGIVLDNPSLVLANHALWQVPVVSLYDGSNYCSFWHVNEATFINFRGGDIYGRRIASNGTFVDEVPFPVATSVDNSFGPKAGYGNGRYLVEWNGNSPTGRTTMAQILEVANSPGSPPRSPAKSVSRSQPNSWEIETNLGRANRIWAFDNNNIYITGEEGKVYRYDGTQWVLLFQAAIGRHYGLWGNGPNDLWDVGHCWHVDHWTPEINQDFGCQDTGFAIATWGSSSAKIYSIGAYGEYEPQHLAFGMSVYHLFTDIGPGVPFVGPTNVRADLWGIWGTGHNNVYVVGELGTITRFNGTNFSPVPNIPTYQSLNAIWGTKPNDIVVVGDNGVILHFNGTSWVHQFSGTTENLYGVWGFNDSSVYAVGAYGTLLHYDGNSWNSEESGLPPNENLVSVAGAGNTVRAVSELGTVLKKTENDCVGTIVPSSVSVNGHRLLGSVSVSASSTCSWTAKSNYSWIRADSSGNGNGTVTYVVETNTENGTRIGSVTIAGQTFMVTQDAQQASSIPHPRPTSPPHITPVPPPPSPRPTAAPRPTSQPHITPLPPPSSPRPTPAPRP